MASQNITNLPAQTGSADPSSLLYAVTGGTIDTSLPLSVLFTSPVFTGSPTVPGYLTLTSATSTYAPLSGATFTGAVTFNNGITATGTNSIAGYAALSGATFTGSVTIPTVVVSTSLTINGTTTITSGSINGTTIGGTTPSTGAFTTLSSTGTTALGATHATSLDNTPIGATTRSTGAFTTLSATGAITPSTTNGIIGTTAGDNANAGAIGEYISASAPSAISLTNGSYVNVISISLTAGDWEVDGIAVLVATGTVTALIGGVSSVSNTNPQGAQITQFVGPSLTAPTYTFPTPKVRFNLTSTTTIYLGAQCNFSTGTATAQGKIQARRVR